MNLNECLNFFNDSSCPRWDLPCHEHLIILESPEPQYVPVLSYTLLSIVYVIGLVPAPILPYSSLPHLSSCTSPMPFIPQCLCCHFHLPSEFPITRRLHIILFYLWESLVFHMLLMHLNQFFSVNKDTNIGDFCIFGFLLFLFLIFL